MAKFTEEDDALLDELGVEVEARPTGGRTHREERIIAGFEDIQRFVSEHGRTPMHGEDRDIFERLYAVRLDRIRELEECRALLAPLDHQGVLTGSKPSVQAPAEELDDDALLAELGVAAEASDLTQLKHVRPSAEKLAAEETSAKRLAERAMG
jgi:hypothetical protein